MAGGEAMAPLNAGFWAAAFLASGILMAACSPEARRVRDGGPGADPLNKRLVEAPGVDPKAADTTLWPGDAPAPVDRLAAGTMPPPQLPKPSPASGRANAASQSEQRAFTESATDPRTGPERR